MYWLWHHRENPLTSELIVNSLNSVMFWIMSWWILQLCLHVCFFFSILEMGAQIKSFAIHFVIQLMGMPLLPSVLSCLFCFSFLSVHTHVKRNRIHRLIFVITLSHSTGSAVLGYLFLCFAFSLFGEKFLHTKCK